MGKRAAMKSSTPPTKAAKVAKVVDPNLADYRNITKGLKMDPDLPYTAQEMLTEMMPYCLGEVKEKRHAIQQSMVEVYEGIFANIEKGLQNDISGIEAQVRDMEGGEKSKRTAAVQEAEANKAAKDDDTQAKKHSLADVARTFQDAKNALWAAEEEQRVEDKNARVATTRLVELQSLMADMIEPLSAGTLTPEEIPKNISSLVQTLTIYDFDKSLLTSIPNAMGKAPAERGQFDAVVVEQLKTETVKRIESFSRTVETEEPEKRARAAKVERLERELATAREKQNASADAFTSARNASAESDQDLEGKKQQLSSLDLDVHRLLRKRDTLQNKLNAFREMQLGSLRKLIALPAEAAEATAGDACE